MRKIVPAIIIALLATIGVASVFYFLFRDYLEEEYDDEDLDFDDCDDYFTEEDNIEE